MEVEVIVCVELNLIVVGVWCIVLDEVLGTGEWMVDKAVAWSIGLWLESGIAVNSTSINDTLKIAILRFLPMFESNNNNADPKNI